MAYVGIGHQALHLEPGCRLQTGGHHHKAILIEAPIADAKAVKTRGFGMPGHIRISLTVERDTIGRALPGFERAFRNARGGAA